MRGADVAAVQRILRHSDPRLTTETYGHLVPDYLRTQIDRLSFGPALPPPFPNDDPFVVASARTLGDPPAPCTLNPQISCQAEEIVLRAIRRDPVQRYSTAAAMMHDLEHPAEVVVSGLRDRLQPVTRGRRARHLARHLLLVGVVPMATQVVLFVLLWYHFARRP